MAAELKRKPLIARQNSSNAPLIDPKHSRSHSAGNLFDKMSRLSTAKENQEAAKAQSQDKENLAPNAAPASSCAKTEKLFPDRRSYLKGRALKPTSLQLCMLKTEPDSGGGFGSGTWDPVSSGTPHSGNVWDFSDSETAPASSWSTLPNRALLYRPLLVDIGRCTCIIVKERAAQNLGFANLYSLYTYEGQGRQNRKLALAYRKRRGGRSEFVVAQNLKGLLSNSDDSFVGSVRANLVGSRYYIWDQQGSSSRTNCLKQPDHLQGIVAFTPTIATWTGSYRSMKAWIPKHQQHKSQMNNTYQNSKTIPKDWEGKIEKVHQLLSKVPHYNNVSKQYELDFRERTRAGLRIQSSVKNFQLTMEGDGTQTILQLGRVGKSKYVMDYRYPLSGYQAFCICLASIDPKLCCTL